MADEIIPNQEKCWLVNPANLETKPYITYKQEVAEKRHRLGDTVIEIIRPLVRPNIIRGDEEL